MAPHRLFLAALFSLCLGHMAWASGQVVTVFAAASLKNALDALVPQFERDTGHRIEKMEGLGIYEVAPEDFALIDYVSTSKIEAQAIVREALDLMIKEVG